MDDIAPVKNCQRFVNNYKAGTADRVFKHVRRKAVQVGLEAHDIVYHDIDHQIPKMHVPRFSHREFSLHAEISLHSTFVQFVRKSLEVVRSSESAIEFASIGDPIAMVRVTVGRTGALVVLRDGTDPDYGKCLRNFNHVYGNHAAHWR